MLVGLITGETSQPTGMRPWNYQELSKKPLWTLQKPKKPSWTSGNRRQIYPPLHTWWLHWEGTFTFYGTVIFDNLSWSANTSAVIKKVWQRMHFLRVQRKNKICEKLLVTFYHYHREHPDLLLHGVVLPLDRGREGETPETGRDRREDQRLLPPFP